MNRIKGIDVSKHQKAIDWQKVGDQSDVEFVFVRVAYRGYSGGKLYTDPYWKQNIEGALANGLDVGAYIYCCSVSVAEAQAEAHYICNLLAPYKDKLTLPVVFDYEGMTKTSHRNYGQTQAQINSYYNAFKEIIEAEGYESLMYGSKAHIAKKFDFSSNNDYLWVARYAGKNSVLDDEKYFPHISGYDDRIAIWQYANNGSILGINGNVDLNFMYIDIRQKTEAPTVETKPEEVIPLNLSQAVMTYSRAKNGNEKVSANFKVKEFACNDGSDPIFISPSLVEVLQAIRNHFGKPLYINSAYRTPTYNKKVGGATYSQHLYGKAADIRISGVTPKKIAEYAETLLPNTGGIGIYANFVHIDVREVKSRWNG